MPRTIKDSFDVESAEYLAPAEVNPLARYSQDWPPHFRPHEFTISGGMVQVVPDRLWTNIAQLAWVLENIRSVFDAPIRILSGYRSPGYNKSVGGAPKSQHLLGKAADIIVKGVPASQVAVTIEGLILSGCVPEGGLGRYKYFTHYDIRGTKARWGE